MLLAQFGRRAGRSNETGQPGMGRRRRRRVMCGVIAGQLLLAAIIATPTCQTWYSRFRRCRAVHLAQYVTIGDSRERVVGLLGPPVKEVKWMSGPSRVAASGMRMEWFDCRRQWTEEEILGGRRIPDVAVWLDSDGKVCQLDSPGRRGPRY